MQPTRTLTLLGRLAVVACLLPCTTVHATERKPARHFNVVNTTFDSVTGLAIAPAGSGAFHDIALDQPLQGGLNAMTFDVPAGGCLRELRVTYRDDRTVFYPRIDVCRYQGLRLGPRDGRQGPSVAASSSP